MTDDILQRVTQLHEQTIDLYMKGQYEQAILIGTQAIILARHHLGEDKPIFATSLNNLAEIYHVKGDHVAAEMIFKQAAEGYRSSLGDEHPLYAQTLSNLASLYNKMGMYRRALPLHQQALRIRREALGEDHPDVANSCNNLALLYFDMGNYSAAEPLYRQSLEIQRTVSGEDHPFYAQILNNLGALYTETGDYAEAERLYQRAMEIRRTVLGEEHPDYALTNFNLAQLYRFTGNYAAAESLLQRALGIWSKVLGENHPLVARTLNGLALLHQTTGDYAEAERLYQRAMEIRRTVLGEEHPDYAQSVHNLADLFRLTGHYAAAEPLLRQAMEIFDKALGESNAASAYYIDSLAILHHQMGDYAEAERLYQRAMEIRRTVLGEEHPDYARSLYNLAMVNAATHREAEAIQSMREVLEIEDRIISQVFSIGSESQRMAYLKLIRNNVDAFLSLIVEHFCHATTDRQTALNLVLRRKAIGAEALAVQRDAVLGGHYPMLSSRLRALTTLRMQIAAKILSGPGPEGSETHQQVLAEWNSQREQLEGDLVHQIPEMSLKPQLQMADCQAVAKALPEESILIELVRFIPFDFRAVVANGESFFRQPHYLAFVMHAGEPDDVRMVDLGEAEPIDRVIVTFRNSITREGEDRGVGDTAATANGKDRVYERDPAVLRAEMGDYSQGLKGTRGLVPDEEDSDETLDGEEGIRLRAAVFDKLVPHLGGSTRLFVAPDGELYRLPFEALPTSDGQRLIDEYRISYLGSGRDVLRFAIDSAVQAQPPLVAVDPDFDMGSTDAPSSSQTVGFRRLSGTKKEGERIAQMLGVTPLVGDGPLEATVKNARSPRILHIATHGFFRPDTPRDPNAQAHEVQTMSALDGGLLARLAHVENPLLRSGLALVGANTWLKGGSLPEEAEDGILMAEDVTGMDLLATELAVLSACQTGLGEVHSGEGVYGLRRAFVVAGAKTLVMSLWKVPDEQTRELMEDFYRRLLRGTPRVEALRKAQLEMKNKHADPFYWGAFICQGDAGPLS
jgi:CHAT domain-containing protein/tetratricopeptide (TPR) repeat protein